MNNLYRKIAITSVCTALGFALGANTEAKAATFILHPSAFLASDRNQDGLGDYVYGNTPLPVGIREGLNYGSYGEYYREEYRAFYEVNLANLSLPSDTVISSAIFQTSVSSVDRYGSDFRLQMYGYIADGRDSKSDFQARGELLYQKDLYSIINGEPRGVVNSNVLPFITQQIKNNNSFAGFGFRFLDKVRSIDDEGLIYLDHQNATLTITAEAVPEPATIFGSAIGLCLTGWLKRKKSVQQKKTWSQH
jgi:hypothetical protein